MADAPRGQSTGHVGENQELVSAPLNPIPIAEHFMQMIILAIEIYPH